MNAPIQNRYDFVYLFDVTDGNPNGDPDAGNMPRIDAETGQGLVTDVCLKRKVRNYVSVAKENSAPYRLFIKEGAILNHFIKEPYFLSEELREQLKLWEESLSKKKKRPEKTPTPKHIQDIAARWLCDNFFDIRFFGAVLATGDEQEHPDVKSKIKLNAGQVRGPIQMTISRSIDPIVASEFSITRCAVTNEDDALKKDREMGRKFTVPYGLYMGYGYINASLAGQTGFGEDDLMLFKQALNMMFETDRSAARGRMSPVKCVAFRHENKLGNARADQLFARIKVKLKDQLQTEKRPPRSKDDYTITVAESDLPAGVTVEHWV